MNCETVRENLTARAAGELGEAERRELEAHLAGCQACAAAAEEIDELWGDLDDLPDEKPGPRVRARFEALLAREELRRETPAPGRLLKWLPIAASLVIGIGIGWLASNRENPQVVALERQMGDLREILALTLLERGTVSERLEGVSYGRAVTGDDDKITAALFARLVDDPSVNVRLAAIEALRPLATNPTRRGQMVDAVLAQKSPLVAISLIDVLLESDGAGTRKRLEELTSNSQLDPAIRGYLRDRLGRSA